MADVRDPQVGDLFRYSLPDGGGRVGEVVWLSPDFVVLVPRGRLHACPEIWSRPSFRGEWSPHQPPLLDRPRILVERASWGSNRRAYLVEKGYAGYDFFSRPTGRRLELRLDGTMKEYFVPPEEDEPPEEDDAPAPRPV